MRPFLFCDYIFFEIDNHIIIFSVLKSIIKLKPYHEVTLANNRNNKIVPYPQIHTFVLSTLN
jgi:hypothetical protein